MARRPKDNAGKPLFPALPGFPKMHGSYGGTFDETDCNAAISPSFAGLIGESMRCLCGDGTQPKAGE
jgi:hypothetical protein